jgi:hypothetical protein
MREGATTLAKLAAPSHPEYQFVFDPSKLLFYAATCYTWLGETERRRGACPRSDRALHCD